jgi:hypothetical protein
MRGIARLRRDRWLVAQAAVESTLLLQLTAGLEQKARTGWIGRPPGP